MKRAEKSSNVLKQMLVVGIVLAFCGVWHAESSDKASQKKAEQARAGLKEHRAELKAEGAALRKHSPHADLNNDVPVKTVIESMDQGEKEELAGAVGVLYDRLSSGACLKDKELLWAKRVLSCFHINDGANTAALIRRIYGDSLIAVKTVDQLNQLECLIKTVHAEMVSCTEVEQSDFNRSKIQKNLARKRLSLMKESSNAQSGKK